MRFTSRCTFPLAVLAVCLCSSSTIAQSQEPKKAPDDPARRQAYELFQQGKFVDAMPLFEKLAADHPGDYGVKEGWAFCLIQYAVTLSDSDQRKKVRARARAIALQAKDLGDNSQLLQTILEQPEHDPTFSDSKEVDQTMKIAEADFARGNLDKARESYLRAFVLDPQNYSAALFIGDVYFKQHVYGSAGEWFSRAIQIDPNRETAYRYWGDALVAMGKDDEARTKYIEGIVAEPYNRSSWVGLTNWLQRNKLVINKVQLKDHAAVTEKDEKHINITLDSSLGKDGPNADAWLAYGLGLASWHTDKFKKEFPNEPKYRRSLKEEADSLALMITVLKEQKDYPKNLKALDPALQELIKIQAAGFLDPFVLINRADMDIAKDYEAYRATNRENIRRYLDEFVVPKTPAAATE